MANITDLLTDVRDTEDAIITTVASSRDVGGTTLAVVGATGWPTATAVHFITYKKNSAGYIDKSTQANWKAVLSGTTLGSLALTGGTDAGNAEGDFVEMAPTPAYGQDLATWGHTHTNEDGTLKTDAATTVVIKDANVTTAKVADGAITNAKLSTSTGEVGAPWQSWTPTFTNFSLGNGNVVAKYTQVGKTVHFRFVVTIGSTSAMGTNPIVSLPVTAISYGQTASGQPRIGLCNYERNGITNYAGVVVLGTSTSFYVPMIIPNGGSISTSTITATFPFTPVSGDEITAEGTYEAA